MKTLHLITQDNQPMGSRRKCCERCGLAIFAMDDTDSYAYETKDYTSEIAKEISLTRCTDMER